MLIGRYIQKLSGLTQFSPPFPRGGQGALFSLEILSAPGGARSLDVFVQHKNQQDTTWTTLGHFTIIGTAGVKTLALSGFLETLRLGYSIAGAASQPFDVFYVNVPAPTWRP